MKPGRHWLLAVALITVLGGVGTYAVSAARIAAEPTRIEVRSTPITDFDNRDPAKVRFGALEFRGGLALTTSFEPFGGISAIHIEPDGSRFLAVTDRGSWLRGRIVYRDGRPDGVADIEMAPILGADGRPLAAQGWYDVESMTERDGLIYLGIERVQKIVRFDFRRDGFLARAESVGVPADFATLSANKGPECLTAAPKQSPLGGKLITVSERSLDGAGNLRAYALDGKTVGDVVDDRAVRFSVKRSDDFEVSDCVILPPGDLLLLERRYSPARGVGMRMRRVPLAAIKDGATVDGAIMIDVDLAYQIDNMEGMALHRNAAGETVITLVSDDNFSAIQRNLLLQFVLVGE
jgi:hypothetical protein